ncbi:hypothetical protein [Schinkia azotoformans]|uniref:hypothetical protein n=1 Tax=Schinkia azotoformans TaxID=1454 RepID=UPI002DBB81D2|nr:hypothetical protein [Schinkia azotoformans]MEC1697744.1 hypothetical protein [Schinkia azotoformans]
MDSTGQHTILSQDGMLDTWQQGNVDNVDETHPLALYIYVPEHTSYIKDARLRIKLLPFRSYSKGIESSPSTTVTSSAGGGIYKSTEAGGAVVTTTKTEIGHGYVNNTYGTTTEQNHNHGIPAGTQLAKVGGGSVTWSSSGMHSHEIYAHSHEIELGFHQHLFQADDHFHNLTVPSHTHQEIKGIFEGSTASGVSCIINGVDRTTALGGKFYGDRSNLDITKYILLNQWNEIKLTSNQLGRIDATVFLQAFIRM